MASNQSSILAVVLSVVALVVSILALLPHVTASDAIEPDPPADSAVLERSQVLRFVERIEEQASLLCGFCTESPRGCGLPGCDECAACGGPGVPGTSATGLIREIETRASLFCQACATECQLDSCYKCKECGG